MFRRDFLTAMAGLAALPLLPSAAQAASWVKLGERNVNPVADHDRIHVGAGAGDFSHIRIKVRGNDLFLYDLDVRFSNGGHQDVPVRFMIPQGGQTRAVNLEGSADRNIKWVDFNYGKPVNWRGATWIELWGKR
ncbi:MAG: hypothetical protein WAT78_13905 [Rhizobiaceae bacterium]